MCKLNFKKWIENEVVWFILKINVVMILDKWQPSSKVLTWTEVKKTNSVFCLVLSSNKMLRGAALAEYVKGDINVKN